MANHAGFAVVAEVSELAINDTLRLYHIADLIPAGISDTSVFSNPLGPGQANVEWRLFLDAPQVTLTSGWGSYLTLNLRLSGSVSVTASGMGTVSRSLGAATSMLIRPEVDVVFDGLVVKPRIEDIVVHTLDLHVVGGAPSGFVTMLTSPGARAALTKLLRANLGQINSLTPPLLVPVIKEWGLNLVKISRLTHRVLNGVLAIGLDVAPKLKQELQITTNGKSWAIKDFIGQSHSDVGVCINTALLQHRPGGADRRCWSP